jgi:shikimate 5-dehydrogenase
MAASKVLELRSELSLSSLHMNAYFAQRHWDAECIALPDREPSELTKWLPYVQENALALRFDPELSTEVLPLLPRLPTNVNWLETADCLIFENKEWWPRLFLYETFRTVLIQHFSEVDTTLCAYVVGATRKARAAAAAIAALGFSHIRFIESDSERLETEMKLLKRYLFGVEISGVDPETLTMESIPGSMMLNTLPMQDHSTVLADLSYFNFMKQGSVVIDAAECTERNSFLAEAESADLKIFSGLQYQSQLDVDLLKKIFPQHYITYEDYFESFADHMNTAKNQPSV